MSIKLFEVFTENKLVSIIMSAMLSLLFITAPITLVHFRDTYTDKVRTETKNEVLDEVSKMFLEQKDTLNDLSIKIDNIDGTTSIVSDWVIDEMIRQVEKQQQKIVKNPGDLYSSDITYVINNTWPRIPENRKTTTLIKTYDFLVNYYDHMDK